MTKFLAFNSMSLDSLRLRKGSISNGSIILIGGFVLNQQPFAELLQRNPQIIFIDINRYPAPFSLTSIVTQLYQEIFQYAALQITLLAYSAGGLPAIQLTREYPKLIQRLVLINSPPCFIQQPDFAGISRTNFDKLAQRLLTSSTNSSSAEAVNLSRFKDYFTRLSLFPYALSPQELTNWQSPHSTTLSLHHWLEIILHSDLRTQLAQISCPILSIYASDDSLIRADNPPLSQAQRQQILPNSSHGFLVADSLYQQLAEFIE